MDSGENSMSKITFEDKTYRVIDIDGVVYDGKDSAKNRTSDYIINTFGKDYFDNKRVLDLACASGAILFEIRNRIKKGVGVDVDSKKLNIGKLIAHDNDISNIIFHEERLEEFINKIDESYDCVFLLNILHHIQDPYGVLNIVAEITEDIICIEAPAKGFYRAYARDVKKDLNFNKLNIEDITNFLTERNYTLIKKSESENQESFIGPTRYICIYKKKRINFSDISEIKKVYGGLLVGPGASGKTKLLHDIYGISVEYKGTNIIKNKVFNDEGKSLKFGKNISKFTKKYPIAYIAPNYKSVDGFKPNIDAWVKILKEVDACAIVCYVRPHVHRERLINRLKNKGTPHFNQHTDNYPFSYQSLLYKFEQNDIKCCVINTE